MCSVQLTYTERRRGYGAIERAYGPMNGDCCVIREHDAAGMFWLGNVEKTYGGPALLLRVQVDADDSREFYCTVRDGSQTALLAGPYFSHADALACVNEARRKCQDQWPMSDFYEFGTASLPKGTGARVKFPGIEPPAAVHTEKAAA